MGREPHLAAVEPLLLSPRAVGLTLVEVTGAPGIGKTALLHELQARAERPGLAVRVGRASELGRDLPYGVVRQALGDDVLGPVEASAAAGWTRYRLWERVRASVEDLGRGSGVLLCLDDVHWADAARPPSWSRTSCGSGCPSPSSWCSPTGPTCCRSRSAARRRSPGIGCWSSSAR